MSAQGRDIDIARNVRIIEWLKAELAGGVASLFRAMLAGGDEAILDALAGVVVGCYLLGGRLGFNYARLDLKVEGKIRAGIQEGHELDKWSGDLTALLKHLEERKA